MKTQAGLENARPIGTHRGCGGVVMWTPVSQSTKCKKCGQPVKDSYLENRSKYNKTASKEKSTMKNQAGYQGERVPSAPKGPKIDPSQQTSPFAKKDNHAGVGKVVKSVPSVAVPGKAPKKVKATVAGKAPAKIKVNGTVYEKVPMVIRVKGTLYKLAIKGKGLGTPGDQMPKVKVSPAQPSKGNSKPMPLPSSTDTAYLRGKGKK